jgi:predicted RNA-binding protein
MMTKTRSRLTTLEKASSTDDVIVIFDLTEDKIIYQDAVGDYREITPDEYDQVKDEVITVRIRYADITS